MSILCRPLLLKNRGIVMLPVYLEVPSEAKKIINKNVGYMFELLK